MATLQGSSNKKHSSVDFNLQVSEIYLEDTPRVPNDEPDTDEFVSVEITYHFMQDNEPKELTFHTTLVELAGEDTRRSDIESIIKQFREQASSRKKQRVDITEELYTMFDIELGPEPGYKNRVDVAAQGEWGVDDYLVMRIYPSDEKMLQFADELESELNDVIARSREKYKDRYERAISLGFISRDAI